MASKRRFTRVPILRDTSHTSHDIVRAQKTCPNAVPRHFQNHVVWSRALKCSVKSYVTGPSTKCYFDEFFIFFSVTHRHTFKDQSLATLNNEEAAKGLGRTNLYTGFLEARG